MTSVAHIAPTGKTETKKDYHSPDTFFASKADASSRSAYDAVHSLVEQAHASVVVLMADGDEGQFSLNHKLVINLLWAIDTQLGMAKAALRHMNQSQ